jgi:hypothetical protein
MINLHDRYARALPAAGKALRVARHHQTPQLIGSAVRSLPDRDITTTKDCMPPKSIFSKSGLMEASD